MNHVYVSASGYAVAPNRERATVLLNMELVSRGLEPIDATDMSRVDMRHEHATI